MHYITYKVIGFFRNKNIKLVAAAVELLLFLRLLHTSILLLLSFRHFELLNSERAKAKFENTVVKSGSCLADELSSEQLYLRNVEEFYNCMINLSGYFACTDTHTWDSEKIISRDPPTRMEVRR